MQSVCQVQYLGEVEYETAWRYQEILAEEIGSGKRPPTLLLLEHPHTFTFGRRGREEHLLWNPVELQRRGVAVFWVDRGGDITYHGPGQLVGYPIMRLSQNWVSTGSNTSLPAGESFHISRIGFVDYLRKLEETLILSLSRLGAPALTIPGKTGVWVDNGKEAAKIAAIGIKVDAQGFTRHGFALNVCPNMEFWSGIIGCGLKNTQMASLAEVLDPLPTMQQVSGAVIAAFGEIFGFQMDTSQVANRVELIC